MMTCTYLPVVILLFVLVILIEKEYNVPRRADSLIKKGLVNWDHNLVNYSLSEKEPVQLLQTGGDVLKFLNTQQQHFAQPAASLYQCCVGGQEHECNRPDMRISTDGPKS